MSKPVTNRVASVMDRLHSTAKERKQPFDLILTRCVLAHASRCQRRSEMRRWFCSTISSAIPELPIQ